ncbi:MAG: hypothetical protein LKI76_04245 [Megasphaera sp.]|nr:hypothetical protein [Megasphaera sp.]
MTKDLSSSVIVKEEEWKDASCDKYDYMIAVFCGAVAGIIDSIFVGMPGNSQLGKISDVAADGLVKKFASLCGWSPKPDNENSIASAIGFLEREFPVNYDQVSMADVDDTFQMTPKNHHFKSLSHSPDPIGLFFSILDQFMNTSSFLSDGQLIRIDTADTESPLKGKNFVAKIFSGFCNWLGHIMSDMAGSSGGRISENGRGSGVSIPFMELFQMCDFGSFQVGPYRNDFATVMTKVFQNGYDLRFAGAMAIPVVIEELLIRALWAWRFHYDKGNDWGDCLPTTKHADLRIMLIVGNATFCLIDATDAEVRALVHGENVVYFILHLNYIAWARLLMLVVQEMIIRYGPVVKECLKQITDWLLYDLQTPNEKKLIREFYDRIQVTNATNQKLLQELVITVQKEYTEKHISIDISLNKTIDSETRIRQSAELAKSMGVAEDKIMKSEKDYESFFS